MVGGFFFLCVCWRYELGEWYVGVEVGCWVVGVRYYVCCEVDVVVCEDFVDFVFGIVDVCGDW